MLLQASAGKENEGMTETASLPIGLFDSGVGGLTVLKALQERLPCENYRFLGDTARLPYGTKGRDTIIRYTLNAAHRLVSVGAVKMLVIACNTATSCALPSLRKDFPDIPVLGVVEPGARAAVRATRTGYIAVLATEATIKGGAYQEAIFRLRPDARVVGRACPLFVPLAEEGLVEGEIAEAVERLYVSGLFEGSDRPDTVVLGCTHYPLLRKSLARVIGRGGEPRGFRGGHGRKRGGVPHREKSEEPLRRARGNALYGHGQRPALRAYGRHLPRQGTLGRRRGARGHPVVYFCMLCQVMMSGIL